MPRTCLLLAIACVAGCATTDDSFDLTLSGDSKADELGGRRVHWEVGERHDWFAEHPELGVTVGIRGGTLMLLHADVAELRPFLPDGTPNYEPGKVVSIGIQPVGTNVELAFVLADGAQLAQGELSPVSCGGTQMFKTLALDFARGEVMVDGMRTLSFSACGIAIDAKNRDAFNATTFALLAVPWRTTDGSPFKGTYAYRHVVEVR